MRYIGSTNQTGLGGFTAKHLLLNRPQEEGWDLSRPHLYTKNLCEADKRDIPGRDEHSEVSLCWVVFWVPGTGAYQMLDAFKVNGVAGVCSLLL